MTSDLQRRDFENFPVYNFTSFIHIVRKTKHKEKAVFIHPSVCQWNLKNQFEEEGATYV